MVRLGRDPAAPVVITGGPRQAHFNPVHSNGTIVTYYQAMA